MDYKSFPRRRIEMTQPIHDFGIIRVSGETFQGHDLGLHGHVRTVNLHRWGAVDHRFPARAGCLKTDCAGRIESNSQFLNRNCLKPWNRPQSTSNCLEPEVNKYLEPVTVPVAPKKVISM
jgi:hypothetical protein